MKIIHRIKKTFEYYFFNVYVFDYNFKNEHGHVRVRSMMWSLTYKMAYKQFCKYYQDDENNIDDLTYIGKLSLPQAIGNIDEEFLKEELIENYIVSSSVGLGPMK